MALKRTKCDPNGVKIFFFFSKNTTLYGTVANKMHILHSYIGINGLNYVGYISVARIFDWGGGGQTTNHV